MKKVKNPRAISLRTAARWMKELGFEKVTTMAGFCDGHERDDVVAARKEFVQFMMENEHRMIKRTVCEETKAAMNDPGHKFTEAEQAEMGVRLKHLPGGKQERPLLCIYHDESTYYAGDMTHKQYWGAKGNILMLVYIPGYYVPSIVYNAIL